MKPQLPKLEEASFLALERELDVAHGVQQLLLPKGSPACNWSCIGVKNRMAQRVGGDFFDFVTLPDGSLLLFLGDVTGHGIQASLVMGLLLGYLHRSGLEDSSPLRMAREVNDFLWHFARRSEELDHFFSTTLFLAVIEPRDLTMRYLNAGQVAPLICRNRQLTRLDPTGQPLGFFAEPDLSLRTFQLQRHDRLLLYTDGIVEAGNASGELFGQERLERLLVSDACDHLAFLDTLFGELRRFGVSEPPLDDCTAIVMDLNGPFAWSADAGESLPKTEST
ncbi:MAG: serine/threonine-protein phosphatase [Desulfuromonas sp.]|nr:MAG: serine/threonine-protein phosphatase [Desulfuromonas sp.]